MKSKDIKAIFVAILFFSANQLFAVGPGKSSMTKHNVKIGNCLLKSITVKWKLDSLMGEATVGGSYKYQADCELPSSTKIYLKVSRGSDFYGYVKLAPVVPKANSGYGYNVTGSPNWNKALCGSGNQSHQCHTAKDAKTLWKQGSVTDFVMSW